MEHDRPVRFLDVGAVNRELRAEILEATARVLDAGWYVLGPEVEAFEAEWAAWTGAEHAIGMGNGLDALTLALRALGIGPGDEVLVPSNTYIATWLAVSAVGARPVPVEPDPRTHVIEPHAARSAVTPRTAAMIPVHLYGLPVDVDGFERLAAELHIALVFDAAQAHGATVLGRPLGGRGHATAWSFYPAKNLGALGDAGAVTTDDQMLAARLRALRNYGSEAKYVHHERGLNSRLDELQAAVLRVKLPHLARWNGRRAALSSMYLEALRGGDLALPAVHGDRISSWHLFVVCSEDRDRLGTRLENARIETLIHYPVPPHRQGAYSDVFEGHPALPVAERLAVEVLSLPLGPHLLDDELEAVVTAICG